MVLYEDADIRARVFSAWENTFTTSNRVLNQAKTYGFSLMGIAPDPNIHQMLLAIRVAEMTLDLIINSELLQDNYEDTRLLLNTREQIRKLERVAIALKDEDRVMFDSAIADLEEQCAF